MAPDWQGHLIVHGPCVGIVQPPHIGVVGNVAREPKLLCRKPHLPPTDDSGPAVHYQPHVPHGSATCTAWLSQCGPLGLKT